MNDFVNQPQIRKSYDVFKAEHVILAQYAAKKVLDTKKIISPNIVEHTLMFVSQSSNCLNLKNLMKTGS